MNNRSNTVLLLGFSAIIVGLIALFAWYYYVKTPASPNLSTATIPDMLMRTNEDFVAAENLFKTGDYEKAIASYQAALSKVTDESQKQIVYMRMARASYLKGDRIGAIQLYKQVVANTAYLPATRAYAAMFMGQMYNIALNPSITDEIFKDEPYKTFFVKGDVSLSYRHLNEYASTLYPLATSELGVADWYAEQIASIKKKDPTASEIAIDKKIIDQKLKNASADIARTQSDPDSSRLIPGALRLKADTLAWLSFAGLASSTEAEAAYKEALTANKMYRPELPDGDAHIRYSYAWFLVNAYGTKRSVDIVQLLKPLYTQPDYIKDLKLFFQNSRKYDAVSKNGIRSVAQVDPGFKSYLVSLGWTISDFK